MPIHLIETTPPATVTSPPAAERLAADGIEITLPDGSRVRVGNNVSLTTSATDMCRGMNSLALQVQQSLSRDLHVRNLYVFGGKRGDLPKILWHDGLGMSLYAKPGSKLATAWLLQLLERRPRKVAAIALANKMARIIWAMMGRGEAYRRQPVVA